MKMGRLLGLTLLGAAAAAGVVNVCTTHNVAQEPTSSLVMDQVQFTEVHEAGKDAYQAETNRAGISTVAPGVIAEHLDSPNVEGYYDADMDTRSFSAIFADTETGANFEVVCTDQGMGDALLGANGTLAVLDNGIQLAETSPGRISSNWFPTQDGKSHCLVAGDGMTVGQVATMAESLLPFSPQTK